MEMFGWKDEVVQWLSALGLHFQEHSSLNGLHWFSGNSMWTEGHRTCSPGFGNAGDDTVSSEPNKITDLQLVCKTLISQTGKQCWMNSSCGELLSHTALMVGGNLESAAEWADSLAFLFSESLCLRKLKGECWRTNKKEKRQDTGVLGKSSQV